MCIAMHILARLHQEDRPHQEQACWARCRQAAASIAPAAGLLAQLHVHMQRTPSSFASLSQQQSAVLLPTWPPTSPLLLSSAPPAAYSLDSAQYAWLLRDLAGVDRARTPWLIVSFHAPWYNSNYAHQVRGRFLRLWGVVAHQCLLSAGLILVALYRG